MASPSVHPTSRLLVEGNDDLHVILALCKRFDIPVIGPETKTGSFSIANCNGFENLMGRVKVEFKTSATVSTVGIIVDADTDIISRWQSIQSILTALGFHPPVDFPNDGLITVHRDRRKAGVWIMPNNVTTGMLEDFIAFLIPNDDRLIPKVDDLLLKIERKELNPYNLLHKPKARIHTWLGMQESPGTPLGSSITKRYLTTDDATCLMFIDWLKRLFES